MADAKGDLLLDEHQSSHMLSKRKPDAESAADEFAAAEPKKLKPDASPDPLPTQEHAGDAAQADQHKGGEANGEEEEQKVVDDDGVDSNGKAAVDKGKGVVTAVDKGKGKMVVEDEEEGEEGDDSDDSDDDDSGDDSGDAVVGDDYESDFADDPLAEVDLSNILPSRTRRRDPPPPGAYLVNDLDGDEEDEDEDDEVCD